ncbi:hypothetical protein IT087_01205 [Candidatus Uhrbacteria bacterium]|nr:hypothetical protein [Candidatus Uhrbacteria bacterium]
MPLQCQNCQNIVATAAEMEGCRSCSKPPPPPSKSVPPRYDASAPVEGLDMETLAAFQDGKLLAQPKPTLGDLLRARHETAEEDEPAPMFV